MVGGHAVVVVVAAATSSVVEVCVRREGFVRENKIQEGEIKAPTETPTHMKI